ncbi:MAG: hypothetical protein B5M51_02230 [Anaerolinea sp. 4484_236]|nr:MAG: hypothetical protein B5M51_02230 [Anaerolinea sp. 4484_236]
MLGTAEATINLLDITHEEIGNQVEYVLAMLRMLGVHNNTGWERAVLDTALMNLYKPIWDDEDADNPTLPDLHNELDQLSHNHEVDDVRVAAGRLAFNLHPYTTGSRADLFGHHTKVDFSLDYPVNVFDVSRLPQQEVGGSLRAAMLAILVANVNQSIRARRRAGDTAPILFFAPG